MPSIPQLGPRDQRYFNEAPGSESLASILTQALEAVPSSQGFTAQRELWRNENEEKDGEDNDAEEEHVHEDEDDHENESGDNWKNRSKKTWALGTHGLNWMPSVIDVNSIGDTELKMRSKLLKMA